MNDAIIVSGLRKTYPSPGREERRVVLDDVDLSITSGEVFALLGPNGAGKTTMVEILEGYRRRDAGDVAVLGQDPSSASTSWRERIGIVTQQTAGSDEVTVEEALSVHATYFDDPRPVGEVLALVGLDSQRRSRVPKLSGGQQRRLDVACGVIGRPELLFLDEPTTGFDPEARHQFWDVIRLLAAEGTTVLLTTHYLDEAEALADRVAVLLGGRIRTVGTPEQLRAFAGSGVTVSWTEDGVAHRVETTTPTAVIGDLTRRIAGEIPDLTVTRPSLEDAYLALVEEHAR